MLWFDRHRRLRDQLSAYIDGALDASSAQRVEAHLAGCEPCRAELLQLRATVAALKELPAADLPRSFVLSPERAAARRPPQPAAPLVFGMRVAAAGVAVALSAVLVADLGDFGGDGAPQGAPVTQMSAERQVEEDEMEAQGALPAPYGTLGTPEAAEDAGAALMGDANVAETPAVGGEAPAAMPDADDAGAPAAAPSGDGIDALTAAEIGLAVVLGVLIAASLVLAMAGRKR